MSKDRAKEKLEKIFYECDRHIKRLDSANSFLNTFMPLHSDEYQSLSDEKVVYIDQFLFRFAKLQDAMGQKLFKWILICIDEEVEGKPFVDILNRLEKLSLLNSANEWRELREDRNELSHNYEDEPEITSETINKLFKKHYKLIEIYTKIKDFYNKKCK